MKRLDDSRWHLDKRIPISTLLVLLVQTGGFVWWAATTSKRLDVLESTQLVQAPNSERLTRVEVKLEVLTDGIKELKSLITQRR